MKFWFLCFASFFVGEGWSAARQWISRTLETVAIGCVVVVQFLMVGIVLIRAGVFS